MADNNEFVASMAAFLLWSFRARGLTQGPNGETLDQLAVKMLAALIEPVRGNRGPEAPFGATDQSAIMDAVAEFHLRLSRSGEGE